MWIYDKAAVGRRLFALRKKKDYTQDQVSELAGLEGRTYADIERGKNGMSIQSLMDICLALETTPDEVLMGGVVTQIDQEERKRLSVMVSADCPPEREPMIKNLLEIAQQLADGR